MEKSIIKDIKELDISIGKTLIEKAKKDLGINQTQMVILMYLVKHKNENVCQKDLEIETHLKKASITGTLDSLEDKGIIVRKQDDEDKRKNIILLSEKTLEIKDDVSKKYREIETNLRKNITDEELEVFFRVIDKMNKNMK